jgi:hypothetical protein
MSKIEELLQEWEITQQQSKQNPVEFNIRIRSGIEGQVVTAKRRLPVLREEIAAATFPDRVVGIFGFYEDRHGTKAAVDTGTFLANNGGVILNADAVYREIADLVEPSYSQHRLYNTAQHGLTIQAMKIILDVPRYKEAICKDYAATVAHIRTLMESVPGNDIQARYVRETILEDVIKDGLAGKTIPVLLIGWTTEEAANLGKLFKKSVFHTFEAGFEPSQEAVVKILKA